MKRLYTLILLGALVLGVMAGACAEPVKLEYKFKVGDTIKHNTTMQFTAQFPDMPEMSKEGPIKFSMTMTTVRKVEEVYPDGSAKLKVWTGAYKMTLPGMKGGKSQQLPSSTSYIKMSKQGVILNADLGLAAKQNAAAKIPPKMLAQMETVTKMVSDFSAFPADPVEVGSTWNKTVPLPAGLGDLNVANTLVSASENCAGMQCAKLRETATSHIDVATLVKAVSSYIASTAGKNAMPIEIPSVSGGVDVSASIDVLFSTELGNIVGQSGTVKINVSVQLPEDLVKQGALPTVRVMMDGRMEMKKI